MAESKPITIQISPGELIDRMTILEIKVEHFTQEQKLRRVRLELESLQVIRRQSLTPDPQHDELTAQLKAANADLWRIEDAIRLHEQRRDFGAEFIALARSIYRINDHRSQLKQRINALFGSSLSEEKLYPDYE